MIIVIINFYCANYQKLLKCIPVLHLLIGEGLCSELKNTVLNHD